MYVCMYVHTYIRIYVHTWYVLIRTARQLRKARAFSCGVLSQSPKQYVAGGKECGPGDAQLAQDECVDALLALGKRKRKQRAGPVKAGPKTQDGVPDDRGVQAGDDKSKPCSADTIAFMDRLSRGKAMGKRMPASGGALPPADQVSRGWFAHHCRSESGKCF